MSRVRVVLSSAMAIALAAACSSASHPAPLPDCTPTNGIPCSGSSAGGASSGGGDASASCAVDGGSAQCDQCLAASCCSEITACNANTACVNLVSCEDSCNLSASCLDECQQQYPTGTAELDSIESCQVARCTICAESGTGDPCSSGFGTCIAGLTCNGAWCTRACAHSTDCAGVGASGDNVLGFPNACVLSGAGDTCAPECASSADCVDFPGTYCQTTTSIENVAVSVCAALPDAATD